MRLDVGEFGTEELLGPLDRESLHLVHILTASIPAAAGVTLGIFVGKAAPLRLLDRLGGEILRGDELDVAGLTGLFLLDRVVNLGIGHGEFRGARGDATSVHFRDTATVAALAFEGGAEPGIDDGGGFRSGGEIAGEAKDVRVVVDAGFRGDHRVRDDGGLNSGVAVRGNGHADPGGATENAEILFARSDGLGNEGGVVGVIDRFLGERARVFNLVTRATQMRDNSFLEFESTVIGADDERGFLHG